MVLRLAGPPPWGRLPGSFRGPRHRPAVPLQPAAPGKHAVGSCQIGTTTAAVPNLECFLAAAAHHAAATLERFNPQNLSNLLWGYASLGVRPRPELLRALPAVLEKKLCHCTPQVGYPTRISLEYYAAAGAASMLHNISHKDFTTI